MIPYKVVNICERTTGFLPQSSTLKKEAENFSETLIFIFTRLYDVTWPSTLTIFVTREESSTVINKFYLSLFESGRAK